MEPEFKPGAVAVIDALGVRGSWASSGASPLATLRAAIDVAKGMKRYLDNAFIPSFGGDYGIETHVVSLSDTVVIAAVSVESSCPPEETSAALLDVVCQGAAYVMRTASQREPPLVYRGAIAVGNLIVDDTLFLGPAIDEAAKLVDLAQGAFVWFAPSAASVGRPTHGGPDVWRTMVREWDVPMKDGPSCKTKALSPFVDQGFPAIERTKIREGYERAMSSDVPDVVAKRENTLRFLDAVHVRDEKLARRGREP